MNSNRSNSKLLMEDILPSKEFTNSDIDLQYLQRENVKNVWFSEWLKQ